MAPDPKPAPRIKDTRVTTRKVLLDPECRGCGEAASEGHHIIPRSKRGDDVLDNIAPVCQDCHDLFHRPGGSTVRAALADARRRRIGQNLKAAEVRYVLGKLGGDAGREYLRRKYCVELVA